MNREREPYWTAFYTKPRSEKKAAERLSMNGFHIYCPTTTVLKQWSDRKKKIKVPLFTSYIFALVNEAERLQILTDPSIVSSVRWLKQPVNIPSKEIDLIKKFLGEFPQASLSEKRVFNVGDCVEISEGIFKGTQGSVFRTKRDTVVLFLQSLNQYLQAKLSINQVDTID